ncbi:Gfo/Idh/MocA family protein [Rhodopirellula sp. MGV]|uniref:Gfo/Idh/MocA family protein n=1 Tax=Rhodopirellula sp. MGV TaxID=2023130 RepID=UPI000B975312|nr:Gfo/Idh/MocA family oxidoreductase [Rhodopirellula sp. MGV]OYP37006.1 dehydrogenase [Rhodopirellula sp. MGV]PNY36231.1 gfo/Idh/MocA family oxidoreductase [Rhodopirellula baltica]
MKAIVVGTGFIGPVHVEALRRAGVEVAGMVGSSPEKSVAAAERLGLPTSITTFEQALQSDDVDSIHLTSPNRLHFEQAKAVLQAGKHVMCEKPLAMDSKQSRELVQLASNTNTVAGVSYNIRFYPLCHEAAARVADGRIGDLFHVTGSYVQDWLLKPTDFNWRVSAEDGGALRAIADIGTHWLDLIQFVTGQKITEVCADLRTVHPIRKRPVGGAQTFSGDAAPATNTEDIAVETEDCGSVMLRFANGANGNLWVSQTTAGRKNCLRFELAGSESSLAFNSESPNTLWIGHRDKASETLIRDPALLSPSALQTTSYPGGHNEGFPDTFKQLFRSFYGYISAGDYQAARPFPTFEEGHYEILICEAILKSHREQAWVKVSDNA